MDGSCPVIIQANFWRALGIELDSFGIDDSRIVYSAFEFWDQSINLKVVRGVWFYVRSLYIFLFLLMMESTLV